MIDLEQDFIEPLDVFGSGPGSGLLGHGALDESPRPQQLQGSFDRGTAGHHGGRLLLNHIDPRSNSDFQSALDLQGNQRLTHGRAGHAQTIGQHALGRNRLPTTYSPWSIR